MARRGWNRERLFYTAMGFAVLVTVFIGFAPSFYLRGTGPPLRPLLQVHGFVFSSWILLFMIQIGLVAAGRTDVHRRLGVLGGLLAIAMLGLGTLTALRSVAGLSGPDLSAQLAFLAIPLFDMVVFPILVGMGLAQRRVPQAHKRLMLIAMIAILSPATGRMPWPEAWRGTVTDFVVPDLFLLPLVAWDLRTRGKLHPMTIFGGLLLVGSQVLRMLLSGTDAWLRFAGWAAGLVA
jgi:hypothetical protein